MAAFQITRRVQFSETDMAGVMHFSNYLRWAEDAEHAFWRSLGMSVHQTQEDGSAISWPRVAVECQYAAPLRFEDEVELRVRVAEIGEKSLRFEIEFVLGRKRVATARTKAACCRVAGGQFRSVEIPPAIRAALAACSHEG